MNAASPLFPERITYSITDRDERLMEEGESQISVQDESLTLLHDRGDAFKIELRDVAEISAKNHKISIYLHTGEMLGLSRLGYRFDDALREIIRKRNEVILKDLLIGETLHVEGIQSDVTFLQEGNKQGISVSCEVRLYETALVVLPRTADVTRIPYSFIQSVDEDNYTLKITVDNGNALIFSKVGRQMDHLKSSLAGAMNKMLLNTQDTMRELIPFIPSLEIREASRLLKEGRAARKDQLSHLSPGLWEELEKNIAEFGMKDYYDFLKGLCSNKDHVYVGLKKGLMANLTGIYLWFMLPILHNNPDLPGNALVLEASTSDGSGRATYFFRVFPRHAYRDKPGAELLEEKSAEIAQLINHALITVNFRREPIYISADQLKETRFKQYQHSIHRIPELRELRDRFIGRVMHHSLGQWQQDVLDLLKFNVENLDDGPRWEKGFELAGKDQSGT